ncbi:MAG: hypothetical protein JWP00_4660 [Chloroflexi bacterium]|jgi:hypothetical protein|nr:hypothetical protein [Chloroflexota bacterium]
MQDAEGFDRRLRRFLFILAALALVITLVELWLQDHTKELLQLLPWGLAGLGLLALLAALVRPNKATLLILRVVMVVLALGGLVGIGVHLNGNLHFQQEIHPTQRLGDFFVAALKGAAPLLAPGALSFAALVALAATYHHPALYRREPAEETIAGKLLT